LSSKGSQSVWESGFNLGSRIRSKLEKVCSPLSAVSSWDISCFLRFFLGFLRGGSALGIEAAIMSPSSRSNLEEILDAERVRRLGCALMQSGSKGSGFVSKTSLLGASSRISEIGDNVQEGFGFGSLGG
jgi:hypothetical protein